MLVQSYEPGRPCWADVTCPDIEKAAQFYGGLFGWEAPEGSPEFGGYRSCTLHGSTVAGMMSQMGPDQPVVWSTYVAVADADATLAKVEEAGGSAMFPVMDVGDLGRMGVFVDPFGAVFGVWQPAVHTGAQIFGDPGAMCWIELTTDAANIERSKQFYADVFGWSIGGAPEYTEFGVGGESVAGMMPKPEMLVAAGMPNFWGVYFAVDNADAAVEKALALGGQVHVPATDIEPGRFAVLADSNGAPFNILQPNPRG